MIRKYKMNCFMCLAAAFLLLPPWLLAQDYSYVNYDVKDGLPSSVVYDAVQDHEGFMWFATENGLCRFDGKHFKTFTTKDGLPDNEIVKLFVDSRGRLWISAFKNEVCYYYKGKIFNRANDSLVAQLQMHSFLRYFVEDTNGAVWLSDGTSSYYEMGRSGKVQRHTTVNGDSLLLHGIYKVNGRLCFYYSKTADISGVMRYFQPQPAAEFVTNSGVSFTNVPFAPFAYNEFIGVKTDSIYSIHAPPLPISKLGIASVESIAPLTNGRVILNTASGAVFFDASGFRVLQRFLPGVPVNHTFQDKENNYWFSTRGKGIFRLSSAGFRNFKADDVFEGAGVSSLTNNNSSLFSGTGKSAVFEMNIAQHSGRWTRVGKLPENGGAVRAMVFFKNNMVVGTDRYIYGNFNGAPYFFEGSIKSIFRTGNSIVGANAGGVGVITFSAHEKEGIVWLGRATCAIYSASKFYIGTLGGLMAIHENRSDTIYFGKKYNALSGRIAVLSPDAKGVVWSGTKGAGIVGLRADTIAYHITDSNGLSGNNISALSIQGDTIWAGTEKGLNRIIVNGGKYAITRYSMQDGLASDIVTAIAVVNNTVYVGSAAGLTYFNPDSVAVNATCNLRVTGIYVNDRYWAYDSTRFSLPHADNDIRFEYAGISFKSAGEITYHYRLVGLNSEWRSTTENTLAFPSLPSGNYTIQLKAVNKFGVESQMLEIEFTIRKTFWEKTWVRLGIIALLAAAVALYVRYRLQRIRKKAQAQQQISQRMAELEQKALRSQMNPHFIFNSLNSIQQYVAERDITGANRFITDFSRLIRMTLDFSTQPLINLSQEINYLDTYLRLERTRLENEFEYRIHLDDTLYPDEIYLPPLLLQPYVENSIRHGIKYIEHGKGLITINVKPVQGGVCIAVEDNGIGREAARQYRSGHHVQYQSKGMHISESRAALQYAGTEQTIAIAITDLTHENGKAAGTLVEITLPVTRP